MKIKAAVLTQTNQPLTIIDDIKIPKLKFGQLLCKLSYAGVCHSQLMEVQGKRGQDKYLPHMLGHEGMGEVRQIGDGITKVKKGDKVILGWIKGDGIDAGGTIYPYKNMQINAGSVTTFSNYTIVSENRVYKLPNGIDEKIAILFGCALPTGAGIIINQMKPELESSVLIYGLGGIGLSALLALQNYKLSNIVAIDIEPYKLELAKELGANYSFKADKNGLLALNKQFPKGFDYAVEAAGKTNSIETAFKLVKQEGGQCIFASHPPNGELIHIDPYDLICGKQIQGSWGGASKPDKDIPIIADLIKKNHLPINKLLSKEYSLEQINTALNDLEQRKIPRALIKL